MGSNKIFFKEFAVKRLLEYDAFSHWKNVKVGTEVQLNWIDREEKIEVVMKVKTQTNVLGVLPSEECDTIKKFLKMGHNVFIGTVTRKNDSGNYNDMLKVAIYIK